MRIYIPLELSKANFIPLTFTLFNYDLNYKYVFVYCQFIARRPRQGAATITPQDQPRGRGGDF